MVTDLGEQPSPEAEPAEPPPGGADAVEENQFEEAPLVPDLSRVGNERAKDEIPDTVTEPEAKERTTDGGGDPDEEEPA